MADFRSTYWGKIDFWEAAGSQLQSMTELATSDVLDVLGAVFDGYAIEANDSYIKVGLVPAGTAELWGSGFTGTSVNGLSLSRLRLNVSGNTADAVGYITFRTGVGGDIYPVGSFSSAVTSYQSGRLTKQLSGDLQVSYSGEINPVNATEVWSAPNGMKLTSRIGGNGQFYQHQFAYQGQTLTIDGGWSYGSINTYQDLLKGDDVFFGSDGNDFFNSTPGNDRFEGKSGEDTVVFKSPYASFSTTVLGSDSLRLQSQGKTDTLVSIEYIKFSDKTISTAALIKEIIRAENTKIKTAGAGNESFQGSEGVLDIVRVAGLKSNFVLEKIGNDHKVTDTTGPGGSDLLVGIDRISFADRSVALDVTGAAGKAYRIYKAAFNRDPMNGDMKGLGYWIEQVDGGMDLVELAARFVDSKEFKDLYGTSPTNAQFLTKLYQNVLGRAPEATGYDWWLNELNTNPSKTKAKVLADFSESGENQTGVAALIGNGITYEPWIG